VPYQYYRLKGTERAAGASVHSFDVEQRLLAALGREQSLRICTEVSHDNCGKHNPPTPTPHPSLVRVATRSSPETSPERRQLIPG
jgi:hypothetical protein